MGKKAKKHKRSYIKKKQRRIKKKLEASKQNKLSQNLNK